MPKPTSPLYNNYPRIFAESLLQRAEDQKFHQHFNNGKRLEQRLAKCRTDEAVRSNYSEFMPRLHCWLDKLGFRRQLTMPSRAFCSDETQGFPTVQIKRQFGIFPFDHGVVGGLLATDRHGPHSHHGEDMLIVQASHVGYDAATDNYGSVRRVKTAGGDFGPTCGKLVAAITPFIDDYKLCAQTTMGTLSEDGSVVIDVDTQYLEMDRPCGTSLEFDRLFLRGPDGSFIPPINVSSVRATFYASNEFAADFIESQTKKRVGGEMPPLNTPIPVGDALNPKYFRCVFTETPSDVPHGTIIANLLPTLPAIVTHRFPPLAAAIANTQAEFEKNYRSISLSPHYKGRNLFYISGVNVDVGPTLEDAQKHRSQFMRTRFIPWAAYYHTVDGRRCLVEQDDVALTLHSFAEVTRAETQFREDSLFKADRDRYGA